VQPNVIHEHLQVGQQPVAPRHRHVQHVDVRAIVLKQGTGDLRRAFGERVALSEPGVKRRIELVETASDTGASSRC
jgi:hypothetical protein